MRLIGYLSNEKHGLILSQHLTNQGIENQLDIESDKDWGSDDYGLKRCNIWIINEDQVAKGLEMLREFHENPDADKFTQYQTPPQAPHFFSAPQASSKIQTDQSPRKSPPIRMEPPGIITLYLLVCCTFLFLWTWMEESRPQKVPKSLPIMAVVSSPAIKKLIYDFPMAYDLADKIAKIYKEKEDQDEKAFSKDEEALIAEYNKTPYWKGVYWEFVNGARSFASLWNHKIPMFEKIRQGEVWRCFTPCLLHGNFLHIIFNMLWLMALGHQVENRIGKVYYILLILLSGVFSNTAQYLMSGPDFLGYSGVICAMLGFIWMRQKYYPWEGYLLERSTILFISFFLFAMLFLQIGGFFLEIFGQSSVSPAIANTAHFSGAFVGLVLGRLPLFSVK